LLVNTSGESSSSSLSASFAAFFVSLRSEADAPAQFAFDRGQLGGPKGLLAFVISASSGDREEGSGDDDQYDRDQPDDQLEQGCRNGPDPSHQHH